MKLKTVWAGLTALALGLGVALIAPLSASAHTGDLNATAACDTATGQYTITYTLTTSSTQLAGSTMWRVGTTSFESTPTSAAGMDRGPVSSVGSQTITLGTTTVPGTSTKAPWAYAFTSWTDGYTKGSDGGDIKLDGKCKIPEPEQVHPTATGSVTCGVATVVFTNGTKYAFAGDVRVDNEDPTHEDYYGLGPFYQIVNIPSYGSVTKTYPFAEDTGQHTVAFRIGLGAEQDWYVPWQTLTVESDCAPNPEDKVEYTEWVEGSPDCTTATVTSTRVKTTTTYELVSGEWVPTVSTTTETKHREATKQECPTTVSPTPPTFVQNTCDAVGTLTLPESEGVDYFLTVTIDGVTTTGSPMEAGTWYLTQDGTETGTPYYGELVVTAVPRDGYAVGDAESEWTYEVVDAGDCPVDNPPDSLAYTGADGPMMAGVGVLGGLALLFGAAAVWASRRVKPRKARATFQ